MKLYVILSKADSVVLGCEQSLRDACNRRGIDYERINADSLSLQDVIDAGPAYYQGLLYRIGTSEKAQELEALIADHSPGITTMYYPATISHPRRKLSETSLQIQAELPIIPTELVDDTWLTLDRQKLDDRIASLGGYPVVIKALGKSHGQGVVKVDSTTELRQLLSRLQLADGCLARKYLSEYRHYRLVVVAGTVVAAIEYLKPANDFRTNATAKPSVEAVDLSLLKTSMKELAISATQLRSSVLSGVDILVDMSNDEAYLAEVNVPCNFARAEGPTGIDIGGLIVEAMLEKRNTEQGVRENA